MSELGPHDPPWRGGRALPVLSTARLEMVPYCRSELEELHALFSDPVVRRYLFDDEIWPRDRVESEIETNLQCFSERGLGQWSLRVRAQARLGDDSGEFSSALQELARSPGPIGFCGFRDFFEPPVLQLIYGLHPSAHGLGLASEAARAAIGYAVNCCGLEQVVAVTDAPNVASEAVMRRLGLHFDRRLSPSETAVADGGTEGGRVQHDQVVYAAQGPALATVAASPGHLDPANGILRDGIWAFRWDESPKD